MSVTDVSVTDVSVDSSKLWLPTLEKEILRPWFLPSREALEEQRRLLASEFFLVRIKGNYGIGESLICDPKKGGCGGKHTHITLRCIAQPFSGLTRGLYAYFRAVGDAGLVNGLSGSERLRYEAIRGSVARMPDLSTRHPEVARIITKEAGLASNDALLAGQALGVLEPIPVTLAKDYARRINMRGVKPRFVLEGLQWH